MIASLSHARVSNKVASLGLLLRVLRASLQRNPCVEGAHQSRLTLMQAQFSAFGAQATSAVEMYWYRDIYGPKVSPIPYR